jgi:hypothetical protein
VPDVDEQIIGGEALETGASVHGRHQEVGVFAQIAGRVARRMSPDRAPVHQGAASDILEEHARVQGRTAAPQFPCFELEEPVRAQPGDVGGSAADWRHLLSQARRRIPVVIVPLRDDRTARLAHSKVSFGAHRQPGRHSHTAHARIARHGVGQVGRVFVHDHQFAIGVVLGLEVGDRLAHEPSPSTGHHHAADQCRLHDGLRVAHRGLPGNRGPIAGSCGAPRPWSPLL